MKVKDIYKQYEKDYNIELYGKPLKFKSIPFSYLPKGKPLMELEVKDIKKIEKEFTQTVGSWKTGYLGTEKKKGYIQVYVE